jgi:hypothetical protein
MKSTLLLPLVMLLLLPSCRTTTATHPPVSTLYSLPPSLLLLRGQTLHAQEGDFPVQSDIRVWSDGAYREQIQRALKR